MGRHVERLLMGFFMFTMAGSAWAQSAPLSAAGGRAAGWPHSVFAPYIDVTLAHPSLAQYATATGSKYFSLGFIVSHLRTCEARWGGGIPLSRNYLLAEINELRDDGGDVVPSFGGAAGTELAVACVTVGSLQAQYQAVIDAYSLTRLDFDVEGNALKNRIANDRRNRAIARLQAAAGRRGKELIVSFTLPVNPTGLDPVSLDLLRNAKANGVKVGIVNVMAMDYFSGPLDMGKTAIEAAKSTFDQIRPIFDEKSDSEVWAMIGITPMIGVNDDTTEVFDLSNASEVLAFSQEHDTGLIAYWDTWRDQQCPSGTPQPSNTCSGVSQSPNAFTDLFKAFTQ
jgi:chitinase